ncbi:DUF1326 domain-containing protein [Teichococcus vastitatis]|uniref:DUF1326 domain-containing protein n=1 Tax=Teichococcus vastitatis TaxID=2307076 RepID=A0ABS9W6F1_9PROT|nr:DUF1326 domain-containing protein [Pseudoroseomonas vastitatis]MCI0754878.1 DUF1326 domain-containing protein [Pseudoroseomonas vastitatis]
MATTRLTGDFAEICDCYTICPCWADDTPDENHCNAVYVWTFDERSMVEDHDVGGRSFAAASFHGVGRGSQSVLFADAALPSAAQRALIAAFSAGEGTTLGEVSKMLGTVVSSGAAAITRRRSGGEWEILVEAQGIRLAYAKGKPAHMDGRIDPMTLHDSALHHELGLVGPAVVQEMDRFEAAVSPLPGGPVAYAGRAGMVARFNYSNRRRE